MTTDIFWFSNYYDNTSFGRVANSLLVHLTDCRVHSILEKPIENNIFYKSIYCLCDITLLSGKTFTYEEFRDLNAKMNERWCVIKYVFLQALYYCKNHAITKMIILTGYSEYIWYQQLIKLIEESKDILAKNIDIMFYVPMDYIPLDHTPSEYVSVLPLIEDVGYVPHAIDSIFKKLNIENNQLIKMVNDKFKIDLKGDEIVVLNANRNIKRKNIQLTIDSFNQLIKSNTYGGTKLRLWLHIDNLNGLENVPKDCIITSNLGSSDLCLIYNVCQIGIQTSSGEGWSFTNCEHAVCGGLQVVPNFLATGYHFSEGRGILMNVQLCVKQYGVISSVTKEEVVNSLTKAIKVIQKESKESIDYYNNCVNHFSQYNWKNSAQQLEKYILTHKC